LLSFQTHARYEYESVTYDIYIFTRIRISWNPLIVQL